MRLLMLLSLAKAAELERIAGAALSQEFGMPGSSCSVTTVLAELAFVPEPRKLARPLDTACFPKVRKPVRDLVTTDEERVFFDSRRLLRRGRGFSALASSSPRNSVAVIA